MERPAKRVGGRGRLMPDSELGKTRPWLAAGMAVMIAGCVAAPHSGLVTVEASELPPQQSVETSGPSLHLPVEVSQPSQPLTAEDTEPPAEPRSIRMEDVVSVQKTIPEPEIEGNCYVRTRSLGNAMAFKLLVPVDHDRGRPGYWARGYQTYKVFFARHNAKVFTTLPFRWIVKASNDAIRRINKAESCTLEGLVQEMTKAARITKMMLYAGWPIEIRQVVENDMKALVEKSVRYSAATQQDRARMCAEREESFKKDSISCRPDEALWRNYFIFFPMCMADRLRFCHTFKGRLSRIVNEDIKSFARETERRGRRLRLGRGGNV